MKTVTRRQLESRKDKAARFARDVLRDEDRAAEIEDESLESYAERRHFQIRNPKGVKAVAIPTRRELLDRIKDLESDNEDMQERLEEIAGLAGEEEEEQGEE